MKILALIALGLSGAAPALADWKCTDAANPQAWLLGIASDGSIRVNDANQPLKTGPWGVFHPSGPAGQDRLAFSGTIHGGRAHYVRRSRMTVDSALVHGAPSGKIELDGKPFTCASK